MLLNLSLAAVATACGARVVSGAYVCYGSQFIALARVDAPRCRLRLGWRVRFSTIAPHMRLDVAIDIVAPVENAGPEAYVRATSAGGALAVERAQTTPT